jgi:hypothetical protein
VSNRSRANGGGRHRCARRPSHSFNAMAIGGAGIILAAPAAAVLLAAPGQAQAAPPCVPPAPLCNVAAAASPVVGSLVAATGTRGTGGSGGAPLSP